MNAALRALTAPASLWSRDEVLATPSPVPRVAGLYAWYFDEMPPGVDASGCCAVGDWRLLYVGISPKSASSRQTLHGRVRYHFGLASGFGGNAAGSTLRLTLGCLLSSRLGIGLARVGATRVTFTEAGEMALSEWMGAHARVCWHVTSEPWADEPGIISHIDVPLNLEHNESHPFQPTLKAIRDARRALRTKPLGDLHAPRRPAPR